MIEADLEPVAQEKFPTSGTGSQKSEEFFNSSIGINQAISVSKASKSQISRDSNAGTLAYTLDENGHKRYKVADLYAKYGFREQGGTGSRMSKEPVKKLHMEPVPDVARAQQEDIERAILQTQLQAKEDVIRRLEEEVRDLRLNRDRLIDQNQRLTMLLPAPKQEAEAALLPEKKSFWKRLFS